MRILLGLVLGLLLSAIALVVVLVVMRVVTGALEARRNKEHAEVRDLLLTVLMGEEDEAEQARAALSGLRRGPWHRAERQIFQMLPKVSGDAWARLVEVVRRSTTTQRARKMLASPSSVVRCRGAHRLGALGDEGDVEALVARLKDRSFPVRRVALRALGNIGSSTAVPAILDASDDHRLTRDVVAALQRIGSSAALELRDRLADSLAGGADEESRIAQVTAIALGLIGDTGATRLLVSALDDGPEALRAEAATALGRVGAPAAVDGLLSALDSEDDRVRRHAASALGEIGDPRAADGLGRALDNSPRVTARALCSALLRLGDQGHSVLAAHSSPYAREALAVAALKAGT